MCVRREKVLLHAADAIAGEVCLSPSDVLDFPSAQVLISNDEFGTELHHEDLVVFTQALKKENKVQKEDMFHRIAGALMVSRRESGLSDIPANIDTTYGGEDLDRAILNHPTAFTSIPGRKRYSSYDYGGAIKAYFKDNEFKMRNPTHRQGIFSYETARLRLPATKLQLILADKLYSSTSLTVTRMKDAQELGRTFVCLRCPSMSRQLLMWAELVCVSHLSSETLAEYIQCRHFEKETRKFFLSDVRRS